MTQVKPELKKYFLTLVQMDREENDRVAAELDASGWDGFPRLLAALFFVAVERKFDEGASSEEIIRFVAELRATLSDGGPSFKAEDAEQLIRANLDPALDIDVEPEMIGRIQAAAVYRILADEKLPEAQLGALIDDAFALATRD